MFGSHGTILRGDALTMLRTLPDQSVQCCVTSPPYWGLRNYQADGQIGLEPTPEQYVDCLTEVFAEVWRALRGNGTLWLNLGDSYIGYHGNKTAHGSAAPSNKPGYQENMRPTSVGADGLKNKDLVGIPWRVVFALQELGWYLRSDIIWHKPNPMPESVKDRPTRAHEYLFLLSKAERYYYDHEAVREPTAATSGQGRVQSPLSLSWNRLVKEPERPGQRYSQHRITKRYSSRPGIDTKGGGQGRGEITYSRYTRNRRSVWSVATHPFSGAHFATFPPELIRPCVLAGCPAGGVVLDPFFGAGTTGVVCVEEARRYLGIELNPDYVAMAERRIGTKAGKSPAIGARDMNFGPSYSKAVSLRTSRVVYCRQIGNAKSDWEVIDSETGEVNTLNPARFKALYVQDWQLPPHMRRIAEAAPSWWDWKAARGRS